MTDSAQLNIHLADFKFVTDQMHVRMRIVSRLTSLSATLLIFTVGFYLINYSQDGFSKPTQEIIFIAPVLFSFSFFLCAAIMLREDELMQKHDRYFEDKLRDKILNSIRKEDRNETDLSFLQHMRKVKDDTYWNKFRSGAKYLFSILGMVLSGVFLLDALVKGQINMGMCITAGVLILAMLVGIVINLVYISGMLKQKDEISSPVDVGS